ncbi:hypothetical protein CFIO01_11600 [Colletotrichum fioriniae PJ7]|uniref:Uncharacterized protein n=1 Tax=Colletotrichum fioriniae PJ7 TaxID=1445577 RepID=A0A010Q7Q5_9PEZI|nr:hypothetical protein CFIO01_11600 [Colletotrichum fioriniae PJ7]
MMLLQLATTSYLTLWYTALHWSWVLAQGSDGIPYLTLVRSRYPPTSSVRTPEHFSHAAEGGSLTDQKVQAHNSDDMCGAPSSLP